MQRRVHKAPHDSAPNLTPVVNIAMVVLVVFMLTASFIEPQPYMQSSVALLEQGGASSYTAEDEPLRVLVDIAPGAESEFTAIVGGDAASNDQDLRALLARRAEALEAAGDDVSETQVEISPQRAVIWQHLLTVYQAAQIAGFSNITFTPGR